MKKTRRNDFILTGVIVVCMIIYITMLSGCGMKKEDMTAVTKEYHVVNEDKVIGGADDEAAMDQRLGVEETEDEAYEEYTERVEQIQDKKDAEQMWAAFNSKLKTSHCMNSASSPLIEVSINDNGVLIVDIWDEDFDEMTDYGMANSMKLNEAYNAIQYATEWDDPAVIEELRQTLQDMYNDRVAAYKDTTEKLTKIANDNYYDEVTITIYMGRNTGYEWIKMMNGMIMHNELAGVGVE